MRAIRNTLMAATVGFLVLACGQTDVAPRTSQPVVDPAPAPARPPKPAATHFDGTVMLSARLEGGAKPAVVGVTNLPEGTLLMVTLSRKQSSYSAQDKATVSGGSFRAGPFSQQGSDLNPGTYTIDIGSPLAALQPASVQAAFGDNGSSLKGPLTGESPIGGTVVAYSTRVAIGEGTDSGLDAAARGKAKNDMHQWFIDACADRCRIMKGVAVKQGEAFDQEGCYEQCLAEIPEQ
jgi:hypothetical protein